MASKLSIQLDSKQATEFADQTGMLAWEIAVLVIGLNLTMRLSSPSACAPIIAIASICVHPLGLLLIVVGLLHLLNTAIRARLGPARPRTRYARATWIPLWYHPYAAPASRSARPWPVIRFDHGQAWAWGTECLLGATIVQAAASLTAQQPIWGSFALLVVLIPLHVVLASIRARVAAHGHG
jgi:hypothetical protein